MSATAAVGFAQPAWIGGRTWDLRWLIGTAVVVPAVLFLVWRGTEGDVINLSVTALIGGPHLFATYVATYGDPRFRARHPWLLVAASIAVPAFVVYWTLTDFQVLLSVFIFAASAHVLHQNAFLVDIYRKRAKLSEPGWARWVDYGLLMLCIYPIASYKLVHSDFFLGATEILLPPFLKVAATYWTVWIAFGLLLFAFAAKTALEMRRGVLNRPKTLLIAVTTVIAFWVPAVATGERLELAFQSVNAWHSLQYFAMVWLILQMRAKRGLATSPLLRRMSAGPRAPAWYYGGCFTLTFALFLLILSLRAVDPFTLEFQQYYYMCVLSCLLIHYVLDAYLFTMGPRTKASADTMPYAVLAES